MKPVSFLVAVLFSLCAFSTQPLDERKAQDALPRSGHPVWAVLGKARITADKKGYYSAAFPSEVKALAGKPVTVTGFMLPLEPKEKFNHFLLSKRTPTCPYCPPGEPNEVIDVRTADPVAYTENIVAVHGAFGLLEDKEMGIFFSLKDAAIR